MSLFSGLKQSSWMNSDVKMLLGVGSGIYRDEYARITISNF